MTKRNCKKGLIRSCIISGESFPAKTAALRDIYNVLAEGSKALQDLKVLPWERKDRFLAMVAKLETMQDDLDADIVDDCEYWPSFSKQPGYKTVVSGEPFSQPS